MRTSYDSAKACAIVEPTNPDSGNDMDLDEDDDYDEEDDEVARERMIPPPQSKTILCEFLG